MNECDGMYMHWLRERIQSEGRYLGNGILKVDVFMNHRVDPLLMQGNGHEFARRFRAEHPSKILTAEISGIAPALATGMMQSAGRIWAQDETVDAQHGTESGDCAFAHQSGRGVGECAHTSSLSHVLEQVYHARSLF